MQNARQIASQINRQSAVLTAKRIFERRRDEHDFAGGYTVAKDHVRLCLARNRETSVPLAHPPGHSQVDFTATASSNPPDAIARSPGRSKTKPPPPIHRPAKSPHTDRLCWPQNIPPRTSSLLLLRHTGLEFNRR